MIDEKYKGSISIVCLALTILLILSALFISPRKEEAPIGKDSAGYALDKDKITEINIQIKEEDWKWLLENAAKEEYRSANVTINGETFYNVGVRPKGNSSLASVASDPDTDRFSLKIDFGQYMDGQTYHGYEKLALNNMMSDATYMKEYLSYDLYDFLGVPVPEYSYGSIKLNGKDWGLYLAVEVIEENFIQREFGSREGNLYKPESMEMGGGGFPMGGMGSPGRAEQGGNGAPQNPPQRAAGGDNGMNRNAQPNMPFGRGAQGGENLKYVDDKPSSYSSIREGAVLKTTTDKEFEKVIEMIKNLNEGTNIEKYLDVEGVLKYFAVNTFLVNLDSYSGGMYHNYYLYEKDGKFTILPWDLNMSFAGFSMTMGAGGNGAQNAINFPIDVPVTGNIEDAPLIGNLLKVDKYKDLYHSYLKKIVNEYMNNGKFENSITKLDNLIESYVKSDATAFYSYEDYKKSLLELKTFGKDRTLSVTSQLSGKQPSNTYGNIETKVNLTSLGTMEMGGQRFGEGGQGQGGGGQMPAAGGQMPNMGAMPPQENMMEIFNVLRNADINNLTAAQKEKLKALGVDENMLNVFKNMGQGGMPPMNMGGLQRGNGGAQGNNGMPQMNGNLSAFGGPMNSIVQGIAILAALMLGLIFIIKYKRKKVF